MGCNTIEKDPGREDRNFSESRSEFHHGEDGSGSLSGAPLPDALLDRVYFSIGASDSLFQSLLRLFQPSIFCPHRVSLFSSRERRRSREGRIFRGKCEADASSRIRGTIPAVWKLLY